MTKLIATKETKKKMWLVYALDKEGIIESSIECFKTEKESYDRRDSLNNYATLVEYLHRAKCVYVKEVLNE